MLPTMGLNGSSPGSLVCDVVDAAHAAKALLDAIHRMTPHGRDYATAADYRTAMQEHMALTEVALTLSDELTVRLDAMRERYEALPESRR